VNELGRTTDCSLLDHCLEGFDLPEVDFPSHNLAECYALILKLDEWIMGS
jgi:hypothetical protein